MKLPRPATRRVAFVAPADRASATPILRTATEAASSPETLPSAAQSGSARAGLYATTSPTHPAPAGRGDNAKLDLTYVPIEPHDLCRQSAQASQKANRQANGLDRCPLA